ncbi:unnamed protein product [Diamesa serratosioi]
MKSNFSGYLLESPKVGHVIVISGKTIERAKEFTLDLSSGKNSGDDIPLQFLIRFDRDDVQTNSFISGEWGEIKTEENPIVSGWDFKFYIMMGDDKFHVAINEEHFCTYNYRMKLDDIKVVKLDGDIEKVFQVDHRMVYPTPWPQTQAEFKTISFRGDFPRPFTPGQIIVITGIPSGDPMGSFFIRFNEGTSSKQRFHFNPRFDEQVVVVNSMNDKLEWLDEIRSNSFPFELNKKFRLVIAITESSFQMAVHGLHFLTYPFRSVQPTIKYAFRNSHAYLDQLTGFKLFSLNGMEVTISSVDHIGMETMDCYGFENYSILS